jgi:hypothetical protein
MNTSADKFSSGKGRSRKAAPGAKPATNPPTNSPAANLEMAGDRLKVYSLAELVKHKQTRHKRPIMTLGDVLVPWFEKTIEKPSEKLANCAELWLELVPKLLAGRTRLMGLNRGTLTVAADNAIVRAELDGALRRGLLRQLQTSSNGTINRVRTCVSTPGIPEIT